jgi:DNA-binding XRE family transcriptional regulator
MPQPLKEVRASKRMTVRALADAADIVPSTVWRIEQGKGAADLITKYKIAQALGVSVSDISEFEKIAPRRHAKPAPSPTNTIA